MQQAGLQIVLSAEVQRAISSLNGVEQAFHDMGEEAERALKEASSAIADLGNGQVSIRRLQAALQAFRAASINTTDVNAIQQYNQNIQLLETEIQRLSNVGRQANANLPGTGNSANSAANALQNLGRVASDAPFGFIAVQNNLDPLIESFRRLSNESGGAGGALKALGSVLTGPAGLALALTAVSSIITVLIQKYGDLGTALRALTGGLSEAEKKQIALNKAIIEAQKSAETELTHLDSLYRAAINVNIPLAERNKIVDELQKRYPAYFKNLSNEAILAGKAATQYANLKEGLIAAANARAREGLIAEKGVDIIKLDQQRVKLQNEFLAALNSVASVQARIGKQKSLGESLLTNPTALEGALTGATLRLALAKKAFDDNTAAIKKLNAEQKELADGIDLIAEKQGAAALGIFDDESTKKTKSNVKTVSDTLKTLSDDITELDAKFLATGGSLEELTQNKLKAFGKALQDLAVKGLRPGDSVFDQLQQSILGLQNVLVRPTVTRLPIQIEAIPTIDNSQTVARLNKQLSTLKDPISKFTQELNSQIQSGVVSAIEGMVAGIGEAFAGGDFSNILRTFASVISSFLTSLGKTLIANGVAIEAFKTSLKSLQGITAIVAGGALIAAAAAFRSLAGKGVPSFATGGIVTSPTLALIGDNPGRKEAVVPSEMFDKLGGVGDMELTARLSGSDLLLLVKRADKELNRFN